MKENFSNDIKLLFHEKEILESWLKAVNIQIESISIEDEYENIFIHDKQSIKNFIDEHIDYFCDNIEWNSMIKTYQIEFENSNEYLSIKKYGEPRLETKENIFVDFVYKKLKNLEVQLFVSLYIHAIKQKISWESFMIREENLFFVANKTITEIEKIHSNETLEFLN